MDFPTTTIQYNVHLPDHFDIAITVNVCQRDRCFMTEKIVSKVVQSVFSRENNSRMTKV